jgi:hypothetical protein
MLLHAIYGLHVGHPSVVYSSEASYPSVVYSSEASYPSVVYSSEASALLITIANTIGWRCYECRRIRRRNGEDENDEGMPTGNVLILQQNECVEMM